MKMKIVPTFEAKLFIGSREGYGGNPILYETLKRVISDYQTQHISKCSLNIKEVEYVICDFAECGWEITAINYPRFVASKGKITKFMLNLGSHLLVKLKQNRITIVTTDNTYMLQADNAEENP